MKTKTKALILFCCAVLLVVTTVFTTMAFLTSQDSVKNTFTVGKVSITLDETDVDDTDKDGNTSERDKQNEYHLIPGTTYVKDPTIHVGADSEECYLFVKIRNDISAIEGGTTVAQQMAQNGNWTLVAGTTDIYSYKETVSANADVTVFQNFTISNDINNETLASYVTTSDNTTNIIEVIAYAVQAEGFEGKTVAEIWNTAFGA